MGTEIGYITKNIVFIIEIIGTVAFAASGAMVGIQKKFDLFGVLILGTTTAVCGGMLRDLILGLTPPLMFQNPVYVEIAAGFSLLLFIAVRAGDHFPGSRYKQFYKQILNVLDAVGLGAFTVIGINTACAAGYGESGFLLTAVGALTGVGGGLLRDIMAQEAPQIFVKHIYAVASIAGALCCIGLKGFLPMGAAMTLGAAVTIVIRLLAAHYRWDLPRAV